MAVVSLIALVVAIGVAALISFQPWAASSVAPRLSVAPDLGVSLGDAVRVASGRGQLAVAPARPATAGRPMFVDSDVVAADGVVDEGASRPRLRIGPAQAVASPRSGRPAQGSPEPTLPEPLPARQPSSTPEAVPVAAPTPTPPSSPEPPAEPPAGRAAPDFGGDPGSPITSGGGPIDGIPGDAVDVDEGVLAFSFYIQPTVYRAPGADNLIMQFKGEASEGPSFGLQLWDDGSGDQRGLWASGDAMGGERFLAPVAEGVWHEAVVYFQASSEDDGFYLLTLDGEAIDARAWVSLIDSGSSSAQIEVGLFRDGERVVAPTDIFFGAIRLAR